jgi:hypothetical protein
MIDHTEHAHEDAFVRRDEYLMQCSSLLRMLRQIRYRDPVRRRSRDNAVSCCV